MAIELAPKPTARWPVACKSFTSVFDTAKLAEAERMHCRVVNCDVINKDLLLIKSIARHGHNGGIYRST